MRKTKEEEDERNEEDERGSRERGKQEKEDTPNRAKRPAQVLTLRFLKLAEVCRVSVSASYVAPPYQNRN